jgi:hypothetical protein
MLQAAMVPHNVVNHDPAQPGDCPRRIVTHAAQAKAHGLSTAQTMLQTYKHSSATIVALSVRT